MATLKATGGSVLGMVTDVAEAVRSGVSGSSVWLSNWASAVADRADTERSIRSMEQLGIRAMAPEIAAEAVSIVVKRVAATRSKDPAAYDQAVSLIKAASADAQ